MRTDLKVHPAIQGDFGKQMTKLASFYLNLVLLATSPAPTYNLQPIFTMIFKTPYRIHDLFMDEVCRGYHNFSTG